MAATASSFLFELGLAELPKDEASPLKEVRRMDEEAQAGDVSLGELNRLSLHE